jgi:WD40 repeat protein
MSLTEIKFPYNNIDLNKLEKILNEEKYNSLIKIRSKAIETEDKISKLITSLKDLQSLLQTNLKKVEEDLEIYTGIINTVFDKLSKDLANVQANEFERMLYLTKLPKYYGTFRINQDLEDGSLDNIISNVNEEFLKLKKEIQNFGKINFIHEKNELIASGWGDKSIKIWDPYKGYTCIQTFNGHTSLVNSIIELQNGLIASGKFKFYMYIH